MFKKFCCIENVDLSRYSTIKIGGRARWLVFPKNEKEIVEVFKTAKKFGLETFVLGNGSNVLFDVDFFDGVVISTRYLNENERLDNARVRVGCGVNLFLLNCKLQQLGLGGMEWSYGIPASFGGLVFMNGGAFGYEIKDFLESITIFDGKEITEIQMKDLQFSYRNSNLGERVVLSGVLKLFDKDSQTVAEEMTNFLNKRKETQPFDKPSLGSVFKRVQKENTLFPAKMIDSLGLKGVKIGGVEVSKKHAGFIVSNGNATANDFEKLVCLIEKKVEEKFDIKLEREVIYLSERRK